MKNILILILLAVSILSVSACGTIKGMGQDFESLGRTMQGS